MRKLRLRQGANLSESKFQGYNSNPDLLSHLSPVFLGSMLLSWPLMLVTIRSQKDHCESQKLNLINTVVLFMTTSFIFIYLCDIYLYLCLYLTGLPLSKQQDREDRQEKRGTSQHLLSNQVRDMNHFTPTITHFIDRKLTNSRSRGGQNMQKWREEGLDGVHTNKKKNRWQRCDGEKRSTVLVKITGVFVCSPAMKAQVGSSESLVGPWLSSQNYQFSRQGSFWSTLSSPLLNSNKIKTNIVKTCDNNQILWDHWS